MGKECGVDCQAALRNSFRPMFNVQVIINWTFHLSFKAITEHSLGDPAGTYLSDAQTSKQ